MDGATHLLRIRDACLTIYFYRFPICFSSRFVVYLVLFADVWSDMYRGKSPVIFRAIVTGTTAGAETIGDFTRFLFPQMPVLHVPADSTGTSGGEATTAETIIAATIEGMIEGTTGGAAGRPPAAAAALSPATHSADLQAEIHGKAVGCFCAIL
jgi:hypothetical protein